MSGVTAERDEDVDRSPGRARPQPARPARARGEAAPGPAAPRAGAHSAHEHPAPDADAAHEHPAPDADAAHEHPAPNADAAHEHPAPDDDPAHERPAPHPDAAHERPTTHADALHADAPSAHGARTAPPAGRPTGHPAPRPPDHPLGPPAPRDGRRGPLTRAPRLAAGLAAALTVALAVAVVAAAPDTRAASEPAAHPVPAVPVRAGYAVVPLHQEGVAVLADGTQLALPVGSRAAYLPGSRVLDPGDLALRPVSLAAQTGTAGPLAAGVLAAEHRAWLAGGTVPGAGGPYEDMARAALLDLHALVLPGGAAVAGMSPRWRYVWPRDASFVAVALARTGHVDDALEILGFLADVQHADGSFEARYLPDGSGPPDERGVQTDGTGWALWAAGSVLAEVEPARRAEVAQLLRPFVARSAAAVEVLVGADGLPPASPDYWEVAEEQLTLGTVAPLVAGLEQAAAVLTAAGDDEGAARADALAGTTRAAVVDAFGPGWARYARGTVHDAASAFVLAPFWSHAPEGADAAWRHSAVTMRRPVGLSPGAGWRDDGVTWTPQTSLYAWTAAASGDATTAHAWLGVLDAHRTATGSIPEKVLADGRPAAVAPLAWSAACVLLALDTLDERGQRDAPAASPPLAR